MTRTGIIRGAIATHAAAWNYTNGLFRACDCGHECDYPGWLTHVTAAVEAALDAEARIQSALASLGVTV